MILGAPCGWVRDRFGIRYPSTVGWAALAPLFWLVGTPGDERFPWAADAITTGPAITAISLIGIGSFGALVQGSGPMEFSGIYICPFLLFPCLQFTHLY